MEVSNNVVARPPHKSLKNGAIIGTVAGAATSATAIGLAGYSLKSLASAKTGVQKRELIKMFTDAFTKSGVDMSKTTVSKAAKQGFKSLKSPGTIAGCLIAGLALGAAIGAVVDMVKNKKAQKAEQI